MTEPRHPMQPIVRDESGTYRFKQNAIVRALLDRGPIDMNVLARDQCSDQDREQFAQLIGYSVDGFCDLSYASDLFKCAALGEVENRERRKNNQWSCPECGKKFSTRRPAQQHCKTCAGDKPVRIDGGK